MPSVEVFNSNNESIGDLDEFEYIWNRKYFEAGDFEIYAPATEINCYCLVANNIVVKPLSEETGIIKNVNIKTDENGDVNITATGRFLSYILHKHLIKNNFSFNGSAEQAIRVLVEMTVINGLAEDKIDDLIMGDISKSTAMFEGVIRQYTDLYDAIVAIAYASGIGFKLIYDPEQQKLVFSCYEAADKSINQDVLPEVEFSDEYENIGECEYNIDTVEEINSVVAEYSGDMGNVVVNYNPTGVAGIVKKEIYLTGKCVTKKAYKIIPKDDGTYSTEEYDILDNTETYNSLVALAKAAITPTTESFVGSVNMYSENLIYKTDYDLGDIVTTTNNKIGKSITQRIFEICEVYDGNGITLEPVFGTRYPVIMDILKK